MRYSTIAFCLALVLGNPWTGAAQKQANNLSKIMDEKLKSSKTLLEGIALADFTKISRSADNLIQLSKTAEWFVLKTPRFEMYTNEFRGAADTIVQKANDKNLDGVTLAYFELTMACVHCHKYVREAREASAPVPGERRTARITAAELP